VGDRQEGTAVTGRQITTTFAFLEGLHLFRLVEDFRELIGADRDLADPAVVRLTPTPYPDDAEAAHAFASSTREELLDRRVLDADTVRPALKLFEVDTDSLREEDALAAHDIAIDETDVDSWLRTLTAIRLVIAERLGITADDQPIDDDERSGVYEWLGYRLELLIQAADELDA
jgi:hypothetical protein